MALDKNILKKKVAGIPVPILAVGGGVAAIFLYRRFGGGGAAAGGAATDGAAAAPSPADYSAGSAGGGGGAADYSAGVGSQGSYFDQGAGGGALGGGAYVSPEGGAFIPGTSAPSYTQPVSQKATPFRLTKVIIRRPRRRPVVINKLVLNRGGGKLIQQPKLGSWGLRPGKTPPIIKRRLIRPAVGR